MRKRGQVSIFMVIGIVLLLLASFLIYIQKYAIERQSELEMRENEIFESDINALQGYLQSVAEDSAEKALIAWSNSSGMKDAFQSGLFFEECDIDGRKQNLTYLYKDGANYFEDEDDKSRARQNLSALVVSHLVGSINPAVFEEKGMALQEGAVPDANISVEFNEFGTTAFMVTPVLVVLKGGLTARFGNMLVGKNVSMLLVENEISPAIERAISDDELDTYTPTDRPEYQKLRVCGTLVGDLCTAPDGSPGDGNAHLMSISLDESLGGAYPLRFEFLVDETITGCSP